MEIEEKVTASLDREEVVFDADRDNNGKGVSPDEIICMLKKNYKTR